MRRLFSIVVCSLFLNACGPITLPTPPPDPPPTPPTPTYTFGIVACDSATTQEPCQQPVVGATVTVETVVQLTNQDGYTLWTSSAVGSVPVSIVRNGYTPLMAPLTPPLVAGTNTIYPLVRIIPPLPPAPTRAEMLDVHITFQGLLVQTHQFGLLPWFEPALPWLDTADRLAVYTAKHASQAWGNGDTHALLFVPSGPPLYDEPNQPYSANRFPALDWTTGGTAMVPAFTQMVHELIQNGFPRILVFLGGDDGERGFPVAMNQLQLVHDALISSPYGNLIPYVVPVPGFDGVFYGYTPEHVWAWGAKCRTLFLYCGIEHSTGHIPTGEGDADWTGNGGMRAYDLLLSEFNDNQFDDTMWQIMARLLGPRYVRPPEQPANDDPGAPYGPNDGRFYLRQPTERGPIVNCAIEFKEYTFVRDRDVATVNTARNRFKAAGATCGG